MFEYALILRDSAGICHLLTVCNPAPVQINHSDYQFQWHDSTECGFPCMFEVRDNLFNHKVWLGCWNIPFLLLMFIHCCVNWPKKTMNINTRTIVTGHSEICGLVIRFRTQVFWRNGDKNMKSMWPLAPLWIRYCIINVVVMDEGEVKFSQIKLVSF